MAITFFLSQHQDSHGKQPGWTPVPVCTIHVGTDGLTGKPAPVLTLLPTYAEARRRFTLSKIAFEHAALKGDDPNHRYCQAPQTLYLISIKLEADYKRLREPICKRCNRPF